MKFILLRSYALKLIATTHFPKLISGLGKKQGEYKPGAQRRHIPLPLLPKVLSLAEGGAVNSVVCTHHGVAKVHPSESNKLVMQPVPSFLA